MLSKIKKNYILPFNIELVDNYFSICRDKINFLNKKLNFMLLRCFELFENCIKKTLYIEI